LDEIGSAVYEEMSFKVKFKDGQTDAGRKATTKAKKDNKKKYHLPGHFNKSLALCRKKLHLYFRGFF
jgi:hypothetical protein